MRRKEILPFPLTWMNLEGIMPREVSETEEDPKTRYDNTSLWTLKVRLRNKEERGGYQGLGS